MKPYLVISIHQKNYLCEVEMQEISTGSEDFVRLKSINTSFAGSILFAIWTEPKCFGLTEGQANKQNNYLCEVEMQEISAGFRDFRQIEDP